ncbi:type II toxin-antitoxin system ParD family antitoxin [Falsirhodobacter deserti]|uniref:type II toxin-antitoxin system ParD family antitoxin n=1 Tax=Falsirhodobacter deserti TaxID=1365611 RepID=UPI000FE3ED0A|nr:type II toxin-antitoxin system ParD family antitoxin [Falsirhodobacter deserti]
MSTMNVSLPEPMKAWVESRARTGRFSNSSDYVRDLIRRDQLRQAALAEVQAALTDGLQSGPATPFDLSSFLSERRG